VSKIIRNGTTYR